MSKSNKSDYPLFSREAWYAKAVALVSTFLTEHTGRTVPPRVNVAHATLNKRNTAKSTIKADGTETETAALPYILLEPSQSKGRTWEIIISTVLDAPASILYALTLALVETIRGVNEKGRVPHGDAAWTGLLGAIGLQGVSIHRGSKLAMSAEPVNIWRAVVDRDFEAFGKAAINADLATFVNEAVKTLGPFPHASATVAVKSTVARESRVTRIKVACQHAGCKFNAQVSSANLLTGFPRCGAHPDTAMLPAPVPASGSKLAAEAVADLVSKAEELIKSLTIGLPSKAEDEAEAEADVAEAA